MYQPREKVNPPWLLPSLAATFQQSHLPLHQSICLLQELPSSAEVPRSTRRPFSPSSSEQTLLCTQDPMNHRHPYPCLLDALAKTAPENGPQTKPGNESPISTGTTGNSFQGDTEDRADAKLHKDSPFLCSTNPPVKEKHPHSFQPRTEQLI